MKEIKDVRILVVGDIMLDKYVVGDVSRISPEAPVPIVKVTDEYYTLGGCGNVVRNIAALGAKVHCAAAISKDKAGSEIANLLNECGAVNVLSYQAAVTTVKERFIADQRKVQMLRVDRENTELIDPDEIISELEIHMLGDGHYDIIAISDYGKGVITWDLMEYLKGLGIPIIIDPKPQNANLYGMPLMITPNKTEWLQMELDNSCKPEFILVTEGRAGMTLYDYRQGRGKAKIDAEPVDVYNVSGAGDTVVAIMAICLSMGTTPLKAAQVANSCAAYVVTQTGTSVVPENIFKRSMNKFSARI